MIRLRSLLLLAAVLLVGCAATTELRPVIIPRSAWNAAPAKPFPTHTPDRITFHHEGTLFTDTMLAADKLKRIQTWGMGPDRKWADIPYHFLIDLQGNIWEGRDVLTVGETNTSYDPKGHILISVLGEYETKQIPNEKQVRSVVNLMAYLCQKYSILPDSIRGHKDYCRPGETDCPGKNWYPYLENGYFKREVAKKLAGTQ
jgi:hypothetical protein